MEGYYRKAVKFIKLK